jgi:hypothetical protein
MHPEADDEHHRIGARKKNATDMITARANAVTEVLIRPKAPSEYNIRGCSAGTTAASRKVDLVSSNLAGHGIGATARQRDE